MRPGVNVTTRESAPPSTIPTDVGTGFMVGVTEAGPMQPVSGDVVQNMDEYKTVFAPSGRNYLAGVGTYDAAETFFNEGGNRLFVGRVVGPAAVAASVNLVDGSAAIALVAKANSPGSWGNNLQVSVITHTEDPNIATGSFHLRVVRTTDSVVLEESYDLVDNTAALSWAAGSGFIVLTAGVSTNDPAAGAYAMTGGNADTGAITNANWQTALNNLTIGLGPGILFLPGVTTGAIYNMAAEAARTQYRVAFLDGPDTATASTLIATASGIVDGTLKRSRFSALFAPWIHIPGLASNTTRKVPPSPAVAGLFCRNMAAGLSANDPAAGDNGILRTAIDLTQVYTDADRQALNDGGVDVIRDMYGQRKVYGWRTVVNQVSDPAWINLGNSIMHRQIVALSNVVGESFIFKQIDGQNRLISQFGAALEAHICMPLFLDGSLFGEAPSDAYKVDVGPSVNTATTISNNELHAIIAVKMSPFGEQVNIEIVKYLVTDQIPA